MNLDPVYAVEDDILFSSAFNGYTEYEYISFDGYVWVVQNSWCSRLEKIQPREVQWMSWISPSISICLVAPPFVRLCPNIPDLWKSVLNSMCGNRIPSEHSLFTDCVDCARSNFSSLIRTENKLYTSISRNDPLFCSDCHRYVSFHTLFFPILWSSHVGITIPLSIHFSFWFFMQRCTFS